MRPLVLLHGFWGAPAAWDGVRAHLPPETPALALALSGHDGAPRVRSFEAEVDRLAALIASSGLERPQLAGYSLGGRLAIGLLARHPDQFSAATLLSARLGLDDPEQREARRAADAALARRLEAEGLPAFLETWEAQPVFAGRGPVSAEALAAWRALRLAQDAAALTVGLTALSLGVMPDYRPGLSAFAGPVTVLTGARDPKFCALAGALRASFPRSAWQVVPGVGHNLPLEAPAAVAEALTRCDHEPA